MSRVCFQYHPDRFRGDSSSEAESALKKFLEIDAAWRILKDQESRRQYDLKLRGRWPTDRIPEFSWSVFGFTCSEQISPFAPTKLEVFRGNTAPRIDCSF